MPKQRPNKAYCTESRRKINTIMKNTISAIIFLVISLGGYASPIKTTGNEQNGIIQECCTVTLSDESTGESATIKSCAETKSAACDRAFEKALKAIEQ
jgi:hypothetical protein